MKKGIVLGLASLFVITGCGSKVVCTSEEDLLGTKTKTKITAKLKGDQVNKVISEVTFEDKDTASSWCALAKAAAKDEKGYEVKCSGKTMTTTMTKQKGDEDVTKDEFVKAYEEQGYKCK